MIRAAASGNRHARRMFVVFYQDRVFRLLRRMVSPTRGGAPIVEDLAQDTFLRAFAALERFDPEGPARASTWLLTIATRRAIDVLRSEARRPLVMADPDAFGGDAASSDAEQAMLARSLARAMDALTPDQRAIFLLREYHELNYDEIAEALGVAAGTVASRLSRARKVLQRVLKGEAP